MSQLKSRMNVINVLYVYELTGEEISLELINKEYDLKDHEFKALEWIVKKYLQLKKMISNFLKVGWPWKRILPLERAMLLYGSFELSFRNKAIVINEIITLAKGYITEESYKFINAILEKVAGVYDKNK
ncbi:MAG: transcription antitermination protein NusB [Mycoplasma sp.]|nr:transcription antitermination protein NusB [Mycoplasma sp.]